MVLNEQIKQSVQTFPKAVDKGAVVSMDDYFWFGRVAHPSGLAPWGGRTIDRQLLRLYEKPHNTLFQGTAANTSKQTAATPWEISKGKQKVVFFQDVLQEAHFGMGWRHFILLTVISYLTQNFGAVWEIVGPGSSDGPLTGGVTAIAHMDSSRCHATGDPEFPIVYVNEDGEVHKMHHERVVRIVDMPSSRQDKRGMGMCALYRAVSYVNKQILISKYQVEKLTNLPPQGWLSASGVTPQQLKSAMTQYKADERRDGDQVFQRIQYLTSPDPSIEVKLEFIPFAELPDHYDHDTQMRWDVNAIALAFGIDPQEIAPLSGASLGTGTQSEVLHKKGRGKTLGDLLKIIERAINLYILPPALEFQFKHRDGDLDQETAENAQRWVDVANTATFLDAPFKAQLVANQVPAIRDVLIDEKGMIRLPDSDIETEETQALDDVTDTAGGDEEEQAAAEDDRNIGGKQPAAKDFTDTREDFTDVAAELIGTLAKDKDRRRFGIRMRKELKRHGEQAFKDGLELGGVPATEITSDDKTTVKQWLTEQSAFVTDMGKTLLAKDDPTTTDEHAKAKLWGSKSLMSIYQQGILSADANMMMQFVGKPGKESCKDCKRMTGQRHRMKDIIAKGWEARSDKYDCGGFNCNHEWKPARGKRAKGRY